MVGYNMQTHSGRLYVKRFTSSKSSASVNSQCTTPEWRPAPVRPPRTSLVSLGELRVKGRKCIIFNPDSREVYLKLLWLPGRRKKKTLC